MHLFLLLRIVFGLGGGLCRWLWVWVWVWVWLWLWVWVWVQ